MKSRKTFKKLYQPSVPDGWQLLEFANFVELSKKKYSPSISKIRCLELEHIEQDTGRLLGWVDSSEQLSTKNSFKKGNVLFGKLRPYLKKYWLATFDGVCSSEIWVFLAKSLWCTDEFLFRLIQQHRFIQVANVSSGTKMPRADWSYVSSFPFIIPPIPEQKAIAKVLGLMDVAIGNVQKTIAQKKLQKKYLMQTLLTGKKRLKGFKKSKWSTFRFRELTAESTARNNGKMSNDSLMAVSKFHGLIPMRERVQGVSNYRCKTVAKNYFAYNPMRLNIGSLARWENDEPAMVSGDYVVFKCIEGRLDPIFFDFYRETNEWANYVRRAGDGSVRVRIYFSRLCPMKLKLPTVDEQKAIAKILTVADWEISLLQTKAELLKLQKKWLMQQLLTGKRRLHIRNE